MFLNSKNEHLIRFCLPIPPDVIDWLDSSPPSIARDFQLDVLIALAQYLTEEDDFDVESLVDNFQDYLIEEFRNNQPYEQHDELYQYETYFADVYLMASNLMTKWELKHYPRTYPLRRCRITTGRICRETNLAALVIDPSVTSLFYDGEFDF